MFHKHNSKEPEGLRRSHRLAALAGKEISPPPGVETNLYPIKDTFSHSTRSPHPQEQETKQSYETKSRCAEKSCSIGYASVLWLWFC